MKYKSLRTFIRFVMNLIADVEIVGMDKFLDGMGKFPEGNAMLAANHLGNLDTAVLLYAYDRDDFILAIAEKYKYHPIIGPLGRYVDAVWLNRFEADFSALREILARMKKGGLMVIAPEGTRSKTGILQEGKMGVAFLASKCGYPVVPISLTGTGDSAVLSNLKRFRRSKIKAVVGEPFTVDIPKGKGREQAMREATDEIMCRIAANLPEVYRGFYKDYPRVKELLADKNPVG